MIVTSTRSGLVEAEHTVTGVAVDGGGRVLATLGGDLERDFFMRSAAKPFQATVSHWHGARLGPESLAVASGSHGAEPIHIALVRTLLAEVGLDEHHLGCPPARPTGGGADRLWAARGHRGPQRVLHNCSGKHAAMLRACVAEDWSLEYTAFDHPLQRAIATYVSELTSRSIDERGVDGCGIPTLRTDVTAMARAFARLATDSDLRPAAYAVARFAPLTSDGDEPGAVIARWLPAAVKGGAQGCIGAAWMEGGVGFAAKCWTGEQDPAVVGIVELMDRVGILPSYPREMLLGELELDVLGGGRPVGRLEATA